MPDLLTQPAVELLRLLATGALSVPELAEAHIRRIERLNPSLNALVEFDPDRIREQARALETQTGPRGPLHGLPLTIKASIGVAGGGAEIGSLLHAGERFSEDAVVVARLRRAGALILGMTNCPEMLMAYETDNRLHGRTSNPWDPTRTSGGSSGGESAAIAAGLSAGGIGSDAGGSVREPAHFAGICALKPTPGRIPAAGHRPANAGPFALLSSLGPMARTAADVRLLFDTVAGASTTEPPLPLRYPDPDALRQTRVGLLEDDGLIPVTPETRQAIRNAARALRDRGFEVTPVPSSLLQALEAARRLWEVFFVGCGAMLIEPEVAGREGSLSPTLTGFLALARRLPALSADALLRAWMSWEGVRGDLLREMERFPLLLTPVCAIPAFGHGEREWTVEGRPLHYLDAMRFTQWFNVLGAPAAVVPVHRSPEGLPIGVQIAGRPWEDELVLCVAAALDRDFGFAKPPCCD